MKYNIPRMNKFINRELELESLDQLYRRAGGCLAVVYGRRRLGKTALLREFVKDKSAVYYMADKAGEVSQRDSMARTMAMSLNEPLLESVRYDSWYDLFSAFDRVRDDSKKRVLIIDEYQYLCQVQPAFSSFIQKWWDEHWMSDNLMVVLCGSLTSMMYKETLSQSSPLYGRVDGQILLRPLDYRHVVHFVSGSSEERRVEQYALCGGVPRYLELMQGFQSFKQALVDGVFYSHAPLHNEARYLLQDEVDVPNTCWSLLEAIASGATRISELASRLALPANSLTRYIALLRDLSIVEREVPVMENNPAKSKRGVYQITDAFLRLWFGCVYPYESFLEVGLNDAVFSRVQPLLQRHVEFIFEKMCRDYAREHFALELDAVRVGRQWGAHYEIDIAGVDRANRLVLAGECKWSNLKVGLSVLRELQQTVHEQKLTVSSGIKWVLFSKCGFTDDLREYAGLHSEVFLVESLYE